MEKTSHTTVTFNIFIPVLPVPASRPRISRYGNYYPKGYTEFRKQMFKFLQGYRDKFSIEPDAQFEVTLEIICKKPKKPTNEYPRGDIDNYAKGYLDSLTYAQVWWEDDIQVTKLNLTKRYQEEGEDYGAQLSISKLTRS